MISIRLIRMLEPVVFEGQGSFNDSAPQPQLSPLLGPKRAHPHPLCTADTACSTLVPPSSRNAN